MRLAAAIVALACAASAAQADDMRESRYGPRSERQTASQTASITYTGPMLGWAGKVQAPAPTAAPAPAPTAPESVAPAPVSSASPPEPSAPWRKLGATPTAPVQAALVQTAPVQAAPVQAAPVQAAPVQPAKATPRTTAALPQSLYAQPTPAPAPQPALRPTLAATPSPPTADALGPSLSRTYSVGRQYGLQPDALPPLKPNGMVFIAPSDTPNQAKAEAPRHGSAEWLAGGPLGDEADRGSGKDLSLR